MMNAANPDRGRVLAAVRVTNANPWRIILKRREFMSGTLVVLGMLTQAPMAFARARVSTARKPKISIQERNKQVVRDYFEYCWNRKDLDYGRKIIRSDYNYHLLTPQAGRSGFDGWYKGVGLFNKAFPDSHWDIRQIMAEGDLVSVRTVWTGTHSAEFLGVPATGRKVVAPNFDLYRLEDGKLAEHWDIPDYLAIGRQLGVPMEALAHYGGAIDG